MGIARRISQWLGLTRADSPPAGTLPARGDVQLWPAGGVARAATLPAVYRALSVIATAVTQVPLIVKRGTRIVAPPAIIRRPDIHMTAQRFVKATVTTLAATGNAWWELIRRDDGSILNAELLPAHSVTPVLDGAELAAWRVTRQGKTRMLPLDAVQHLSLLDLPGNVLGLGPIQACRASIQGALDLREYAAGWFTDGAVPTGVLTTDQQLTPDDADTMRRRWHETQAKREVAVLGKGLSYEPVVLSPSDAQFIESQSFAVTDIARMFGIPAVHMLAALESTSLTYMNVVDADTHFVRYTLMAYFAELETAFTQIAPGGASVTFDLGSLLRPDVKTRTDVDLSLLAAGVLTIAEVRDRQGLPPTTEQDAK